MAKKVSKNQRTDRGKNTIANKMAKIVVAVKKDNGHYSFNQKMVHLEDGASELNSAKA